MSSIHESEQSLYIPGEWNHRWDKIQEQATRLIKELAESLVTIPDFRAKAALAFTLGETKVEFSSGDNSFRLHRKDLYKAFSETPYGLEVWLDIGEAGMPFPLKRSYVDEQINLIASNGGTYPNVSYRCKGEGYGNTWTAVRKIEERIQSFRALPTAPSL